VIGVSLEVEGLGEQAESQNVINKKYIEQLINRQIRREEKPIIRDKSICSIVLHARNVDNALLKIYKDMSFLFITFHSAPNRDAFPFAWICCFIIQFGTMEEQR